MVHTLIDSSAEISIIDNCYAKASRFVLEPLSNVKHTINADRTYGQMEITHTTKALVQYRGHTEIMKFYVQRCGTDVMILGHNWLRMHNPEINWVQEEVTFTRCLELYKHAWRCQNQCLQ